MKIAFSTGEYSDYYILGYYDVPSVDWIKEKLQQWVDDNPRCWENKTYYGPDGDYSHGFMPAAFVNWVVKHEECIDLSSDITEIHLGDYGSIKDIDEKIRPTKKEHVEEDLTNDLRRI